MLPQNCNNLLKSWTSWRHILQTIVCFLSRQIQNMLLSVVISVLVILSGRQVTGDRNLPTGVQLSSHLLQLQEIGQELSRRGHSVYLAMDDNFSNLDRLPKRGIKVVTYHSSDVTMPRFWTTDQGLMPVILGKEKLNQIIAMNIAMQDCSNMMLDEVFMSKITAVNFDLVIFDSFFFCPCTVILAHHLSIPAVSVACAMMGWETRSPVHPAVTPSVILRYSDRIIFSQRLINLAIYLAESVCRVSEHNTTLLQRFAPEVNSWLELRQRTTVLYIVTRDYLLEWPEPQMPNVIHTPGVTTHPAGVLPQQLKELMDAATDGAIIFSFGNLTGELPAEIINKFFVAFSQLRQTVIFKSGGRNTALPSNISKNVHLLPWLPQNDLLGHQNTVLFITHCGNNGQYESLYHGVPMIGFPLFAEQPHNAYRMVDHGYGIDMNILAFTANELVNNIHKVLDEKSFKMATQKA